MTQTTPTLRSVAIPAEHGGWSLTLEPVVLGLVVAPSWAGITLGAVALVSFVAHAPVKLLIVDRWRGRTLERTRLAGQVAAIELPLIAGLLVLAAITAEAAFWWPLVAAAPLIAVGLWYDMRSRSRTLVAELVGSIAIGSVAAAIALADGVSSAVAGGLWVVAGARVVGAVPFVRLQLRRRKTQPHNRLSSDAAQIVAVAAVAVAALWEAAPVAALIVVIVMALAHTVLAYLPSPAVPVLGAQQVVIGLTVVLVTALGALAQFDLA